MTRRPRTLDAYLQADADARGITFEEAKVDYYVGLGCKPESIAAIERRVRELVDNAPPLTSAQIEKLTAIFDGEVAA